MKIEIPISIDFSVVENAYKRISELNPKHLFFEKVLASYECFQDKDIKSSKWNNRKPSYNIKNQHNAHNNNTNTNNNTNKIRIKLGTSDNSEESLFKKELISLLNKLSEKNFDSIGNQIKASFNNKHMCLFINTLWDYFKRQPDFQYVYVKLLESIYNSLSVNNILSMNIIWTSMWNNYIKNSEWKINYELIEQSHNYDDFCEYLKEKKKLNAISQGWSKFITLGIINTPLFEWVETVVDDCYQLDLSNIIYKSMADSYIEQIRDYFKSIPHSFYVKIPLSLIDKIEGLKIKDIQKSTKFKIIDLIENIEKMKKLII